MATSLDRTRIKCQYQPEKTMTNLIIRTIEDDDTDILADLTADVQRIHHEEMPERFKPVPDNLSAFVAFFEKRLTTGAGYIGEIDSKPVGFLLFEIREGVDNPYVYPHFYMHIDQMGIKPNFRGRGIGAQLMKQAIAYANKRDVAHITLNVFDFNDGAVNFYENMGFEIRNMTMQLTLKSFN